MKTRYFSGHAVIGTSDRFLDKNTGSSHWCFQILLLFTLFLETNVIIEDMTC